MQITLSIEGAAKKAQIHTQNEAKQENVASFSEMLTQVQEEQVKAHAHSQKVISKPDEDQLPEEASEASEASEGRQSAVLHGALNEAAAVITSMHITPIQEQINIAHRAKTDVSVQAEQQSQPLSALESIAADSQSNESAREIGLRMNAGYNVQAATAPRESLERAEKALDDTELRTQGTALQSEPQNAGAQKSVALFDAMRSADKAHDSMLKTQNQGAETVVDSADVFQPALSRAPRLMDMPAKKEWSADSIPADAFDAEDSFQTDRQLSKSPDWQTVLQIKGRAEQTPSTASAYSESIAAGQAEGQKKTNDFSETLIQADKVHTGGNAVERTVPTEVTAQSKGAFEPLQAMDVIEQVVEKFDYQKLKEGEQILIRLKPDSLGSLSIRLETTKDGIAASIVSSNTLVKDAVTSQLPQLYTALNEQGIRPSKIEVLLSEQPNFQASQQGQGMPQGNQQSSKPAHSFPLYDAENNSPSEEGPLSIISSDWVTKQRINIYG